jgi:hypothetical protein
VTFTFEGEEYVLIPGEVGFRIDVDATVESALGRGRSGLPGDVVTRLRAFRQAVELELIEVTDEDVITAWVDDLADELDRPEIRGGVTIDAEQVEVQRTMSQGEVVVDRVTTVQLATSAVRAPGPQTFELPAATTEQPIADDEIVATAEDAERALAAPLLLSAEDASLELAPADLAALIEIEEQGDVPGAIDLELVVSPERVDEVIGELGAARFDITPTSASYSASRTPPATFDAQLNATFRPVGASVQVNRAASGRVRPRAGRATADGAGPRREPRGAAPAGGGRGRVPDRACRGAPPDPPHRHLHHLLHGRTGPQREHPAAGGRDRRDAGPPGEQFSINGSPANAAARRATSRPARSCAVSSSTPVVVGPRSSARPPSTPRSSRACSSTSGAPTPGTSAATRWGARRR